MKTRKPIPKYRIEAEGPFVEMTFFATSDRGCNQTLKHIRNIHQAQLDRLHPLPAARGLMGAINKRRAEGQRQALGKLTVNITRL